jgi:hypothetical protein
MRLAAGGVGLPGTEIPLDDPKESQAEYYANSDATIHGDRLGRNSQSRPYRRERTSTQRRFMIDDVHVRLIDYSAGYVTDHWRDLRQVPHVLKGELDSELRRGPIFELRPGMSYRCPIRAMRRIARRHKRVPNSSWLIRSTASRAPYLYRLQNKLA